MFVLVCMNSLRLSLQSSKWITSFVDYSNKYRDFYGVLGTRMVFLELKIGSVESEKSGPYRSIPDA